MTLDRSARKMGGAQAVRLTRFLCASCGYGASARIAFERCPICSCCTWELEPWRPFKRAYATASTPRDRLAGGAGQSL
jgi:hypothetical protein